MAIRSSLRGALPQLVGTSGCETCGLPTRPTKAHSLRERINRTLVPSGSMICVAFQTTHRVVTVRHTLGSQRQPPLRRAALMWMTLFLKESSMSSKPTTQVQTRSCLSFGRPMRSTHRFRFDTSNVMCPKATCLSWHIGPGEVLYAVCAHS